jgi:hypothetical protein
MGQSNGLAVSDSQAGSFQIIPVERGCPGQKRGIVARKQAKKIKEEQFILRSRAGSYRF